MALPGSDLLCWKIHDISGAMSGHGHHDADVDHHDETTSDDFPADEPRSPAWLPLLGGSLFLAAIFAFVIFGSDDKSAESTESAKEAAVTAAPAKPIARPTQRPIPALRPGSALPPGHVPVAPRPNQ